MLSRIAAMVKAEFLFIVRDPFPYVVLILMPLVVIAFVKPAYHAMLLASGFVGANGAEQAVPGMAVLFVFLSVGSVGHAIFREFEWRTWVRLRTTRVRVSEVVIAKALPYALVVVVQQMTLFLLGSWIFGLRLGSGLGLLAIAACLGVTLAAGGVAVVAVVRTWQQVQVVQTVGTMVLAGIGGALTPVSLLPGWSRHVSPITPTYWAMRGYRSILLFHGGFINALTPCAVLLGFGAAGLVIAITRLRFEVEKVTGR